MKKAFLLLTILCFFITSVLGTCPLYAQEFRLPAPGVRVDLSPEYNPPILKGIKVHPDNPFRFDFIMDTGNDTSLRGASLATKQSLKEQSTKLIKYFLASLTIPEKDLWVNLSPYEKNRIVPESFGQTEMGRDLLAEDYMLKQITASLIYPEGDVGKKFWKRVYEEAAKKFGTTNIPVNTFNKVWIIPEKAVVYENTKAGTAYVVESKLKVMLEQDYLALEKNSVILSTAKDLKVPIDSSAASQNDVNALGSQVVREIVLPELTKEVNEDKNFAQMRQGYNSLILATWYKKKIKDSILAQVYEDKKKVAGVEGARDIEAIYQRYLQAFKKGVYNYIKEDINPITQETVPRKYFSGGADETNIDSAMVFHTVSSMPKNIFKESQGIMQVTADFAMLRTPTHGIASTAAVSISNFLKGKWLNYHDIKIETQFYDTAYGHLLRADEHQLLLSFKDERLLEFNVNIKLEGNVITRLNLSHPKHRKELTDNPYVFKSLLLAINQFVRNETGRDVEEFETPDIHDQAFPFLDKFFKYYGAVNTISLTLNGIPTIRVFLSPDFWKRLAADNAQLAQIHRYIEIGAKLDAATQIYAQTIKSEEGRKRYIKGLINEAVKSNPGVLQFGDIDQMWNQLQEGSQESETHQVFLRDEQGIYWILKKREEDPTHHWGNYKNDKKREIFAYLLLRGKANLAEIRAISSKEAEDLGIHGSPDDYYLSRVVMPANIDKVLPHHERSQAFSALFVAHIFLRKDDPHLFNLAFVDNDIPVSIDQDHTNAYSEDYISHFLSDSIGRPIMEFTVPANLTVLLGQAPGELKSDEEMVERFHLGLDYVRNEELDKRYIAQTIKAIKSITNIRALAQKAGYSGQGLEDIIQYVELNQKHLGADVDHMWKVLTGESGGFQNLDDQVDVRYSQDLRIKDPDVATSWTSAVEYHLKLYNVMHRLVELTRQYGYFHMFPQKEFDKLWNQLKQIDWGKAEEPLSEKQKYEFGFMTFNVGNLDGDHFEGAGVAWRLRVNLLLLASLIKSGIPFNEIKELVFNERWLWYLEDSFYYMGKLANTRYIIDHISEFDKQPERGRKFSSAFSSFWAILKEKRIPYYEIAKTFDKADKPVIVLLPEFKDRFDPEFYQSPGEYIEKQKNVSGMHIPSEGDIEHINTFLIPPVVPGESHGKVRKWFLRDGMEIFSKRVDILRTRYPDEEIQLANSINRELQAINPKLHAEHFVGIVYDRGLFYLLSEGAKEVSGRWVTNADWMHIIKILKHYGVYEPQGEGRAREVLTQIGDHHTVVDFETIPYRRGKLRKEIPVEMHRDNAMLTSKGGIDLTPANMNLQTQHVGEGIKFHIDPAILQELRNAPGFVPVIIHIEPMRDLRAFLEVQ